MFSNNTESRITATYQDTDGTIDLEVSLPFSGLSDVTLSEDDSDKFLQINDRNFKLLDILTILKDLHKILTRSFF